MDTGSNLDPLTEGSPQGGRTRLKGVFDYLLIIRDRWLLAVALSLPAALGYVYYAYQEPEIYHSSASYRLIPPPSILNLQKVEREHQVLEIVGKHLDQLNGRDLRTRVIERITNNREHTGIMLAPFLRVEKVRPAVAATVQYSVSLSGEGRPKFTIISTARSAEGARLVADLAHEEYESLHKSQKGKQMDSATNVLEQLLAHSQQDEAAVTQEIQGYKIKNGLANIEDDKQEVSDRKGQYQSAITKAEVERLRIDSLLRQVIAIQGGTEASPANGDETNAQIEAIKKFFEIDVIETFGNVPTLRETLLRLERERRQYEQRYLERHPKMIENRREVLEVRNLLFAEVKSAIKDLKDKRHQLLADTSEFTRAYASVQQESKSLSSIEAHIVDLMRKKDVHAATTNQILKRLNEVRLQSALPSEQEDPLHKEDFAILPGAPISPDKSMWGKIHRYGFFIFAIGFVLLPIGFEFIDNRVKSPWDIEVFLGRDLIAGIPKISAVKESDRPLIVGNELDDGLTESFRSMYSRIQMNSKTDYPKSILITSAIPSEGKSLLAANLAYCCANHGRKTVLLDYDLRRPGLHKFCGVSNDRGLLTLINEMHEAGHGTGIEREALTEIYPNLFILPSGGKTRAATEMLEKPDFDTMLYNLRQMADVLIIDSPPVALFPDSIAMARKVDEILFVTRYGKVARKVVKNLLESLDATGANVLGVVLNDLPEKKTPGYYYSGYYGYGYFRYKYYNKYYGKLEASEAKASAKKAKTG